MEKIPKISIITPSFNQGKYIEETIKSVLDQNYPNLEYIIIDGGSTDGTVEVIRKYESRISYWVSEKDRGQTHAINKGLARASGDIIAYINSDDYYASDAFRLVADEFIRHPQASLIHGICAIVNEQGEKIDQRLASITQYEEILDLWGVWWNKRNFVQPEVFWTKAAFKNAGYFNESLFYVMDYEYWLRILKNNGQVLTVQQELSNFRRTSIQKSTHSDRVALELLQVVEPFYKESNGLEYKKKLRLLGNLYYQKYFLSEIRESINSGDSRWARWFKLVQVIMKYPGITQSDLFIKKIFHR